MLAARHATGIAAAFRDWPSSIMPSSVPARLQSIWPGVTISALLAAIGFVIAWLEELAFGHPILEPLVLALILGLIVRAIWTPPASTEPGIAFAGKQLLEFAIVVLGLTLNLGDIVDAGWKIIVCVLLLVSMTLGLGTLIGRAMGLNTKLAVLVATGNAICGNSAIAAVAPVIRARKQEVAAAIAMTAIFGVGVVLVLPLLVPLMGMSDERYGVVAGLSVYAVPQVLAATFSVSAQAGQIGSLVKLTRVLMLGPVVALMAIIFREPNGDAASKSSLSIRKFLPWFVAGFFLCAIIRTAGLVPDSMVQPVTEVSRILTAVAMAGLGLGVDVRSVRDMGGRVLQVVLILTVILVVTAVLLTTVLGIG